MHFIAVRQAAESLRSISNNHSFPLLSWWRRHFVRWWSLSVRRRSWTLLFCWPFLAVYRLGSRFALLRPFLLLCRRRHRFGAIWLVFSWCRLPDIQNQVVFHSSRDWSDQLRRSLPYLAQSSGFSISSRKLENQYEIAWYPIWICSQRYWQHMWSANPSIFPTHLHYHLSSRDWPIPTENECFHKCRCSCRRFGL